MSSCGALYCVWGDGLSNVNQTAYPNKLEKKMNIPLVLFVVFVCFICIGILTYCINDLIKDIKKMSEDYKKEKRTQKRRKW